MASLTEIRTAIAETLSTLPGLVGVYRTVPEVTEVPAIVVDVDTVDFVRAMSRGTDTWNLSIYVLCSYADAQLGQDALDAYVTGAGVYSIREKVFLNRGLGLTDGTDAHIDSITEYGARYEAAGIDHVGATLSMIVHTPGKE